MVWSKKHHTNSILIMGKDAAAFMVLYMNTSNT
jgi:hypothetical protein